VTRDFAPLLRVGCVRYLNAQPLIFGGAGDVLFDHPAVLCRKLADVELDVALVSSFEYLRNPIYSVVDGVSVASAGPVHSVFLAHTQPLTEI
jgi:predicted solute-binding protein